MSGDPFVWRPIADPPDIEPLRQALRPPRQISKGVCVVEEGDCPTSLHILLQGMARAFRACPGDESQTTALFVPGDVMDAKNFVLGRATASLCGVTSILVAELPFATLRPLLESRPGLATWLLRQLALDATALEDWTLGLGRSVAVKRMAHLFCSIAARMEAIGMAKSGVLPFPLTQVELGDCVGLSTVHVNRVVQHLRKSGMVQLSQGELTIIDQEGLEDLADFQGRSLKPTGQNDPPKHGRRFMGDDHPKRRSGLSSDDGDGAQG